MKDTILFGDCKETLKQFDESARTCITSPPYYGLRDYGTATWIGGDPNCNHRRDSKVKAENCNLDIKITMKWHWRCNIQNCMLWCDQTR